MKTADAQAVEQIVVTMNTATKISCLSRPVLLDEIAQGRLVARRYRRTILIEVAELRRFLAPLPTAELAPAEELACEPGG